MLFNNEEFSEEIQVDVWLGVRLWYISVYVGHVGWVWGQARFLPCCYCCSGCCSGVIVVCCGVFSMEPYRIDRNMQNRNILLIKDCDRLWSITLSKIIQWIASIPKSNVAVIDHIKNFTGSSLRWFHVSGAAERGKGACRLASAIP